MEKINFDSKFIQEEIKKSDQGLANIFKKYYTGAIHVINLKDKIGYVWNNETKLYEPLCYQLINGDISNILRDAIDVCINKINQVDNDILGEEEKLKKRKPLEQIKSLAGKSATTKNVYEYLLSQYVNNNISKLIDNCENVIPLKGGKLINLQTGEIRNRTKEDYFTYEKDFEYLGKDETKTEIIDDFFNLLCCKNKEKKQYLKMVMGQSITNYIKNKCFYIFYGSEGNNGKSTLMATMNKIFDDLYTAIPDSLLYAENKDKISDTQFGSLVGKTIGTSIEPKDKYTNDEILKLLTGGDSINCRRLYSDMFTYTPKIKIFILLNNVIKIGNIGNDHIMYKRTRVINFDAEFVNEPDPSKPNQYKADKDLENKLTTIYKNEFFTYIVNCAIEFLQSSKSEIVPEIIKNETKKYFDSMDYIQTALSETFEFTKNSKDKVLSSEIVEEYKQYCLEHHKKYNDGKLIEYLENKLGKPKKTSGKTKYNEKANGMIFFSGIKYKSIIPIEEDTEDKEDKSEKDKEISELKALLKQQAEEIEKLKKLLEEKNSVPKNIKSIMTLDEELKKDEVIVIEPKDNKLDIKDEDINDNDIDELFEVIKIKPVKEKKRTSKKQIK